MDQPNLEGMPAPDIRRCPACDVERPTSDFRVGCAWCRFCYRFSNATRLGVPYERIYAEQDGLCALCRLPTEGRMHIDHVHVPPAERDGFVYVRGLLCARCNMMVEHFVTDQQLLEKVKAYLARPPERFYLPVVMAKRRHKAHGAKSSWQTRRS